MTARQTQILEMSDLTPEERYALKEKFDLNVERISEINRELAE